MEPTAKRTWLGFAGPAALLLLLGVQFLLGFQGFDHGRGGILGGLQAPGTLLGWGGVVVLSVLVAWLIAGWAGRDLFGLHGVSGLAVRLIGVVALGVAVAGILGMSHGPAAGGTVGAWLGGLLADTLGPLLGTLVLVAMAVPAFVLAISPFFLTGPAPGKNKGRPSLEQLSELEPKPGLYEGGTPSAKPLYPERRYDEDGNEIPMSFDARDVGQIRYLDTVTPEEAEAERSPPKPEPVDVAAEISSLPSGVRWAGEEDEAEAEDTGPLEAHDGRIPLPPGVRFADGDDEDVEAEGDEADVTAEEPDEDAEDAEEDDDVEYEDDDEEVDEDAQEDDDVEYEDDDEEADEDAEDDDVEYEDDDEEADEDAEDEDVEYEDAEAAEEADDPEAEEVDSSAASLEGLGDEHSGARYRAKLAGSGIFDEPAAHEPEASPPPPPDAKPTPPKRGTKPSRASKAQAKAKTKAKAKPTPRPTPPPTVKPKQARQTKRPKRPKPAEEPTAGPSQATSESQDSSHATPTPRKGARRRQRAMDETYRRAVEVSLERGAASSVLLSRRLGIGYAQARALVEILVEDGILGEMTPSGSRPLLVTEADWRKRSGR